MSLYLRNRTKLQNVKQRSQHIKRYITAIAPTTRILAV